MNYTRLVGVMASTQFQTGVSWHFHSLKDEVQKIELEDISADIRLRVRWLSHQAPTPPYFLCQEIPLAHPWRGTQRRLKDNQG